MPPCFPCLGVDWRMRIQMELQGYRPMRSIPILLLLFVMAIPALAITSPSPSGRRFDANGVKLHYIVEGEGEPVVLIHGLYSSARINWQMPGIVSLLSKKYLAI
jgi:hypothetical protein